MISFSLVTVRTYYCTTHFQCLYCHCWLYHQWRPVWPMFKFMLLVTRGCVCCSISPSFNTWQPYVYNMYRLVNIIKNYGKIHPAINGKTNYSNCHFSIAFWHHQRVNLHFPMVVLWFSYGFPMEAHIAGSPYSRWPMNDGSEQVVGSVSGRLTHEARRSKMSKRSKMSSGTWWAAQEIYIDG